MSERVQPRAGEMIYHYTIGHICVNENGVYAEVSRGAIPACAGDVPEDKRDAAARAWGRPGRCGHGAHVRFNEVGSHDPCGALAFALTKGCLMSGAEIAATGNALTVPLQAAIKGQNFLGQVPIFVYLADWRPWHAVPRLSGRDL